MVDNTNQPTTSSSSALHNDTSISALHSDTSISDDKFPLGFNTGGVCVWCACVVCVCGVRVVRVWYACGGYALCLAFPHSLQTTESKTDVASTILRLLYIKDLRMLQTSINDLIGM